MKPKFSEPKFSKGKHNRGNLVNLHNRGDCIGIVKYNFVIENRRCTGRRRGAVFRENSNEENEYDKNVGKRRISKPT